MSDLVDYLRDKLEQADVPTFNVQREGGFGYLPRGPWVFTWLDGDRARWKCRECGESGTRTEGGSWSAGWEHIDSHPQAKRSFWPWRRKR